MIIGLLKGNNYQPNITEDMKAKEARTHVRMDHDYCSSGKRKYPVEDEVTADSGFQLPGKKLRMTLIPRWILILGVISACPTVKRFRKRNLRAKLSRKMLLTAFLSLELKMSPRKVNKDPFDRNSRH